MPTTIPRNAEWIHSVLFQANGPERVVSAVPHPITDDDGNDIHGAVLIVTTERVLLYRIRETEDE